MEFHPKNNQRQSQFLLQLAQLNDLSSKVRGAHMGDERKRQMLVDERDGVLFYGFIPVKDLCLDCASAALERGIDLSPKQLF